MQRGYFKGYILRPNESDMLELHTSIGARRKTSRKPPTPDEVTSLCHEVLVQKHYYIDVAKRHNMRANTVSMYVCKARRNKQFMEELYAKETKLKFYMDQIEVCITQYIGTGKIITRALDIQEHLPPENMGKSRIRLVQKAVREGLNMSYRKILILAP